MEKQLSERQIIRWAIPGWIILFLIAVILFIHMRMDSNLWTTYTNILVNGDNLGKIAAIIGAVIFVGFTLGFILYQIYFVVYWRGKDDWSIVGRCIDYKAIVNFINNNNFFNENFGALNVIPANFPINKESIKCVSQKQELESYASAAWFRFISNKDEKRDYWHDRNTYLFSVYHSLGTLIVGIYLVFVTYTISIIIIEFCNYGDVNWLSYGINAGLLCVLSAILVFGRNDTARAINNLIKHALYYANKSGKSEDVKTDAST